MRMVLPVNTGYNADGLLLSCSYWVLEAFNRSGFATSERNDKSDFPEECESMKYEMFSATDI